MKKFTLLIALFVCAIGFSQNKFSADAPPIRVVKQNVTTVEYSGSSSFTSSVNSGGTSILNGPAGTATLNTRGVNGGSVVITHSNSQTVDPGGSVACSLAGIPTENSYYRDFDLAQDFGIFDAFEVAEAQFGMQTVEANHPMTINVYSLSGSGPLSSIFGDAVLQGTTEYNTTPADAGTVVGVPIAATIPAGDRLVFEVFMHGGATVNIRVGVNDQGQTDATYIASASCSLPDPIDLALIGFPDMHVVMNILGEEVCDLTTVDATGLPLEIDGSATSTADCNNAPNLVPVMVEGINTLGENANIDNLTFSLTHTYDWDLTISLVSPSGTELVLSDQNGSSGDNYIGTIFRDDGTPITEGSPPFTGTFAPQGAGGFSVFDGEFSAGEWNLKICDGAGGDTGIVFIFEMSICNIEVINNDVCEDAFEVACDDVVFGSTNTILHTDTGGNSAPDAWYQFTGSGDREIVTLSTCGAGTDYDTYLRVFDACDGEQIAFNDDACPGFKSELSFLSDGSSTYYIMVEGYSSNSGNFEMQVTCEPTAENDLCEDAADISCNSSVMGLTSNAIVDSDIAPECSVVQGPSATVTAPGVWYVYEDNTNLVTDIHITTCSDNTDYDTKLSVYTGDCDGLVCVIGNDDDNDCAAYQSSVDFQSDGNTTYYILVHGYLSFTGNFELTVDCTPVPPDNDDIANAMDINDCPYTDLDVAMPAATTEGGNPEGCNIDGANGVWYKRTPDGDGTMTVTIESPVGLSHVTFYTADDKNASEEDLTLVDYIDNQCIPGTSTSIPVVAGQTYYVFVVNSGGRSDITIDCLLAVNDNIIEGFSYYPNPANHTVNLSALDAIESVVIYNILGQKVIDLNVDSTNTQIDVSSLYTGTYLMKVSVNGEIGTYKVIKR